MLFKNVLPKKIKLPWKKKNFKMTEFKSKNLARAGPAQKKA